MEQSRSAAILCRSDSHAIVRLAEADPGISEGGFFYAEKLRVTTPTFAKPRPF